MPSPSEGKVGISEQAIGWVGLDSETAQCLERIHGQFSFPTAMLRGGGVLIAEAHDDALDGALRVSDRCGGTVERLVVNLEPVKDGADGDALLLSLKRQFPQSKQHVFGARLERATLLRQLRSTL